MKKAAIILVVLLSVITNISAYPYKTQIFNDNIHTLQVITDNNQLSTPVIGLQSDNFISVSFDELGYISSNFHYRIIHCNSNWEQSALSSMEYLDGFDGNLITNISYSINTTVNYIHYQISFPNEDVKFNVSGNYAVLIARDNDFDNQLVATACFSVVEPISIINADITGNTAREINGRFQQLNVKIETDQVKSINPMQDFILVVKQNGRTDNQKVITSPSAIMSDKLQYINLQDLIFEGGNQYRSIDFSSRFSYGSGIDRIRYENNEYHVYLESAEIRSDKRESYNFDAHGAFAINYQDGEESNLEADYMWVHFYLPLEKPFLTGNIFLLGLFTGNDTDEKNKMEYDFTHKYYYKSLFLKQGGYNYIYVFKSKWDNNATLMPIEGSFWQSKNQYELFLYYKPIGSKYERLVGYHITEN